MNWLKKKIQGLEEEIKESAQRYYSDGSSELSDEEFDAKAEELRKLSPNSPVLNSTGWGYDVSKDTTVGRKFSHTCGEVGSLKKAYSVEEIPENIRYNMCEVSLKLDGLSVVLYYKDGKLEAAATRGDGFTGVDITEKAKRILGRDTLKDRTFSGAVRGEILMTDEMFSRYTELHVSAKNSRNTTAGIINATVKDVSEDLKFLRIYVYTVVKIVKSEDIEQRDRLNRLRKWMKENFEYVVPSQEFLSFPAGTEKLLYSQLKGFCGDPLPCDGLVIKRNLCHYDSATQTIQYSAIAYKFESETALVDVTSVEWNLSKTHHLVPKVRFKPVRLSGSDVSAATGYNAKYILENGIGTGAVVEVEKHGEIIPNINKVIRPCASVRLPMTCPDCGNVLSWKGVHLECTNTDCKNAEEQDLLIWCKTLAPVKGFSDALILKFLKAGAGSSIEAVMKYANQVTEMSLGDHCSGHLRLYYKMLEALSTSTVSLKSALCALNIERLGEITADKLQSCSNYVKRWLEDEQDTEAKSAILKCVKSATFESIVSHRNKFERLNMIKDRICWEPSSISTNTTAVAVTGKLSVPRKEFEMFLKEHNFMLKDVSNEVRYLITDDPDSNSSKNQKADKLGIQKISEQQFRKMLEEQTT